MKTLPLDHTAPHWKNSLLNDLVFIKKHLRYPINKRTIPAALSAVLILFFAVRVIWTALFASGRVHYGAGWFLAGTLLIVAIARISRYWRSLRFLAIPTPFFANENRKQIEDFLRWQQLNVYRHPQAPDVFQILSRPRNSNSPQREVMIFIADDKRILINSHIINQKWSIAPPSRNAGNMAAMLYKWLRERSNGGGIVIS